MKWWMKLQNWLGLRQWALYNSLDVTKFFRDSGELNSIIMFYCKKTKRYSCFVEPFTPMNDLDIYHLQKLAGVDEKTWKDRVDHRKKENEIYINSIIDFQQMSVRKQQKQKKAN